mgnify:CR=1 FL=1
MRAAVPSAVRSVSNKQHRPRAWAAGPTVPTVSKYGTVELLPEIVKSGIMSLKIEGRMKKPEYTAGVVSIYRKYLDLYEKKPSRFHVLPEDMKKLYELYNRDGFNKSYYTVRNGRDMMALKNEKEQENKKKQRRK